MDQTTSEMTTAEAERAAKQKRLQEGLRHKATLKRGRKFQEIVAAKFQALHGDDAEHNRSVEDAAARWNNLGEVAVLEFVAKHLDVAANELVHFPTGCGTAIAMRWCENVAETIKAEADEAEHRCREIERGARNLAQVVEAFTNWKNWSARMLARFNEDFAKDPREALAGSRTSFEAAANLWMAQGVLESIEEAKRGEVRPVDAFVIDDIAQGFFAQIFNRAQFPEHSTSPTGNLMERYELAAYVKALELLGYPRYAARIARR